MVYLEDIRDAIRKIASYTTGFIRNLWWMSAIAGLFVLSIETFSGDDRTVDAVVRNLEVIGEAVKNVPEPVRALHPAVEWRKIAGLRDVLIHAYFGVDVTVVWDVVQNKLPVLREQVDGILKEDIEPGR